jgi:hypothetical protein
MVRSRVFAAAGIFGLMSVWGSLNATPAGAQSFHEVRDRVYAEPLRSLPAYDLPLATAIFNALRNLSGELIDRARQTLADPSDFKRAAPKLIHPVGICAQGVWKITEPSFATGLLAAGTEVPLMARFSIATNDPQYKPGKARNFGVAVKLFPGMNPDDASVETCNILTLDQTGLNGEDRPSIFQPLRRDDRVYFTNDVAGKGFLAWLGQRTFEKLDPPSTFRALYPLAEVTARGERVAQPVAPRLIRIVSRVKPKLNLPVDFRDEILGYGDGELERF